MVLLNRQLLSVSFLMILNVTLTYAALSIYHQRVMIIAGQNPTLIIKQVEGVAVLDLGGTGAMVNHSFDCNTTTTGSVDDLHWEREDGNQLRFPQYNFMNRWRLDMAPASDSPVNYEDTGIYICRDNVTGDSVSIDITGGAYAISPEMPDYEIGSGGSVVLGVFAAGYPPLRTNEVKWYDPSSSEREIVTGERFRLLDGNRHLSIMNVQLEDNGTYRVDICRVILPLRPCVQATTTIELNVLEIPMAVITYEDTSINRLHVQLHRDPPPSFFCAANSSSTYTVMWMGPFEDGTFPNGVTQNNSMMRQVLMWSRAVEYTDSGQYRCIASNSNGNTTAVLDLLVRQRPSIKSISAYPPVSASSSSKFIVPLGYSGPVLNCTALAWPNPSIQWLKNGQRLTGHIVSESSIMLNQAMALLRWTSGFMESDRGFYSCFIQAGGMNAAISITTLTANISTTTPPPLNCRDGSGECTTPTNTSFNVVLQSAVIGGSVGGVLGIIIVIGLGVLIIVLFVSYNRSKKY